MFPTGMLSLLWHADWLFFCMGTFSYPSFKHSQRYGLSQVVASLTLGFLNNLLRPLHKPDCDTHRASLLTNKCMHRIYKLIESSSTSREVFACQRGDLSWLVSWLWCCVGLNHRLHGLLLLADILLRDHRLLVVVHFASCFRFGCFKENWSLSLALEPQLGMCFPWSVYLPIHQIPPTFFVHCL